MSVLTSYEVSMLASTSKLRQQTLFKFCSPTTGSRRGLEKRKQDFEETSGHGSVLWATTSYPATKHGTKLYFEYYLAM